MTVVDRLSIYCQYMREPRIFIDVASPCQKHILDVNQDRSMRSHNQPPAHYFETRGEIFEKREVCLNGSRCMVGRCCREVCSWNCGGLDQGGFGWDLGLQCQFKGNVFIGWAVIILATPARLRVHRPHLLQHRHLERLDTQRLCRNDAYVDVLH
ncbi:putative GPI anchored protein [Aspergillus saccharolyticus JOP 1030-1]|uniref:Uncharacterized protein n=1 Tax=Aspergillus saccharolyticus JOP 1030-1 TaxID=1450539 RepID=A0A318ZRT5_9EURO|nr:hypothetical protein BP01DRAFT_6611 [Aspergillus saccharolyticus JOP 1030-1]PYH49787.1 hypothetical protein BP01DRAFT_6611 [Aspergillus saccharolyticus JOP 1030-1]